jgi:hypothetical protein
VIPSEFDLIAKLQRIEALHAGATTAGEKEAAEQAMKRLKARLGEFERSDPPTEYKFSMTDAWSRTLFLALVRRYGLEPYRYRGQRHTTVMVRVSRRFVDTTLWPHFLALDRELRVYLHQVTDRVVRAALDTEASEPVERDQAPALPGPA